MARLLMPAWFRLLCVVFPLYFFSSESVGRRQRALNAAEDLAVGDDVPTTEPKKARGGHHQRIAQETISSGSASSGGREPPKSHLTNNLVRRWSVGKLSAKDVQDIAMDASRDGLDTMGPLAKMGASGQHPQNLFRAMQSVLGYPNGAPEMDWFELPTTAGPRTPHPFLLPHKFLSTYYAANTQAEWRKTIAGSVGAARQFWSEIRDSPFMRNHPDMPEHLWPSTIPFGMHADGGPFSKTDSLFIISFNSLLGSGTTLRKRFLFTVLRKNEMTPQTLDKALQIFAWSFNALLDGRTPNVGPSGLPLLGGGERLASSWRGALCQVRGDWEFYCSCFGFPRWNGGDRMCFMCRASATIPDLLYTNCRIDAPWRDTIWTDESYRAYLLANGLHIPALLRHAIGLRLDCIMPDVLHTIDLGIGSHIIGNILFVFAILRGVFGGANFGERVTAVAGHMDAWYKRTKCSSRLRGKLSLETIRASGDWPKLRGKAAAIRHLAPYAKEIVDRFHNGTPEDTLIQNVITLLCRFYEILGSESQFVSAHVRAELPVLSQKLAEFYSQLASSNFGVVNRLWKMSPKLHLFEHLCQITAIMYGNPRYFWTYADEDLVGQMIEIAETCHPSTLPFSVLFKWLHCFFHED